MLRTAILVPLLVTGFAFTLAPVEVGAQTPESEFTFTRRMTARIERIQMEIRSIQRQYFPEDTRKARTGSRPRRSGSYGGVWTQLEALAEQCKQQEREVRNIGRSTFGTPYDIYRAQQYAEYNIRGLDNQLSYIKKYLREMDKEEQDAAADHAEQQAPEEQELSDEDWAEEWAKGKDD